MTIFFWINRIIFRVFNYFISLIKNPKITLDLKPLCLVEKYISEIETKFLKTYENNTIEWNDNIYELVNARDYFNIKSNKKLENKWKSRIIFETTPRGNIVMMYDTSSEAFVYHVDNSGIPYRILNAVAMKYCQMFRCRDFFVDENVIPEGYSSPFVENRKAVDEFEKNRKVTFVNELTNTIYENIENSPFANLKSRVSTVNNKKHKTTENIGKMQNRFIFQGKMLNCNFLQKKNVSKLAKYPETSYKSYKKKLFEDEVDFPIENGICSMMNFDYGVNDYK